jgi:hypothetical protein
MANPKQQTVAPSTQTEQAAVPTPNEAAPKKHRNKGVKYTTIVESEFKPPEDGKPQNPLDAPLVTTKGGCRFPGVIFESSMWGTIVKIPAKAVAIKSPTMRQLVKVLQDLYKE